MRSHAGGDRRSESGVAEQLPRHSLRRHLLALFVMLLLAGATVLVLDEYAQYRARQSLEALQSHSLGRLRALKAVSDGYNAGVVDTTIKVRNDLMGWEEGLAALDGANAVCETLFERSIADGLRQIMEVIQ